MVNIVVVLVSVVIVVIVVVVMVVVFVIVGFHKDQEVEERFGGFRKW